MKLQGIIYKHNDIEDTVTFNLLPEDLRKFLSLVNGFVAYKGALHIRGCCNEPTWHSINEVWTGKNAFWKHYPDILDTDIPFGQDCMGDQFILRNQKVIKLYAETGVVEDLDKNFTEFLDEIENDPINALGMHPLIHYEMENLPLAPGQIIQANPPFCMQKPGIKLKAVEINQQIENLASLSKTIRMNQDEDEDYLQFFVGD
ncbi:MAG: SMI1/KNR4 family protein [Cytophagaceae bacterium]